MPAIDITDWVKNTKRHSFYKETVDMLEEIQIHSDGKYPERLIGARRPAESETIQKYRKEIYQPVSMPYFSKVQTSLGKIRKASDYVIAFDPDLTPETIAQEETLQAYTTYQFPKYKSLDNWFWSVCFKSMLTDPNAISLVSVLNPLRDETAYAKPYPVVYNSPNILDYKEDEFYFLKSSEAYYYKDAKGKLKEGNVYYHVTTTNTDRYEQINDKGDYRYIENIHGLNYLPIVKLNGVSLKDNLINTLYCSRLIAMLPEFNEAVREYNDLQAEVVQHVHSTMWAMDAQDCKVCKGVGMIAAKGSTPIQCKTCKGKGSYPFNPYEHFSVKAPEPGGVTPPTPPAGFIQKQIDIAILQDKRIQDHFYRGLSGINFEFLMSTQLNQSGLAKEWDKSECNNFVYSVAEDCVRILDGHYEITSDMRYSVIVPDESKRDLMLPQIDVPVKYDIFTEAMLSEEISRMKTSKFNPIIISASEIDYVGKKFITDKKLKAEVIAQFDLDPLSGRSEDDISLQKSAGGISDLNYNIHCNIKEYIDQAVEEDPLFLENPSKKEKLDKIRQIATASMKKIKTDSRNDLMRQMEMMQVSKGENVEDEPEGNT